MKSRDLVIGAVVLLILAGLIYYRQSNQTPIETVPLAQSTEQALEDKLKIQIPEDVDKAELKAAEGATGTAIATRNFEDNKFTSSVIADLPAPAAGQFYQAWLLKGETGAADHSHISLGTLRTAKGGYLLDYSGARDYSDHGKVQVTLETKADNTPEKVVLEGNF